VQSGPVDGHINELNAMKILISYELTACLRNFIDDMARKEDGA
jgi:hypothetical protein